MNYTEGEGTFDHATDFDIGYQCTNANCIFLRDKFTVATIWNTHNSGGITGKLKNAGAQEGNACLLRFVNGVVPVAGNGAIVAVQNEDASALDLPSTLVATNKYLVFTYLVDVPIQTAFFIFVKGKWRCMGYWMSYDVVDAQNAFQNAFSD